jgi:predicted nucleic acid-binding protein
MIFLNSINDGSVNIRRTIKKDEEDSCLLIDRYKTIYLTLTDAANMAFMTRLGIGVAFSYDHHFLLTGLIRIPPFHLP